MHVLFQLLGYIIRKEKRKNMFTARNPRSKCASCSGEGQSDF